MSVSAVCRGGQVQPGRPVGRDGFGGVINASGASTSGHCSGPRAGETDGVSWLVLALPEDDPAEAPTGRQRVEAARVMPVTDCVSTTSAENATIRSAAPSARAPSASCQSGRPPKSSWTREARTAATPHGALSSCNPARCRCRRFLQGRKKRFLIESRVFNYANPPWG